MAEESVRTRNKAKTQQRLLAAARELFYGGGVCATGVSAVAERAGVTKMTLYAHFPSKEELVAAYWRTATGAGGSFWRRDFRVARIRATGSWPSAMPTGSISRRERCGVAPSSTAPRSSPTPATRRGG